MAEQSIVKKQEQTVQQIDAQSDGGSSSIDITQTPRAKAEAQKAAIFNPGGKVSTEISSSDETKDTIEHLTDEELGVMNFIKNQISTTPSIISDALSGLSSATSGVASIVEKATSSDNSKVSGFLSVFSAGFTAISSAVKGMKSLFDEYKSVDEKKVAARDTIFKSAQSIVTGLNKYFQAIKSIPAGLETSVPAVGIAVSALMFIKKGWHFIEANRNKDNMYKRMEELEDNLHIDEKKKEESLANIHLYIQEKDRVVSEIAMYELTLKESESSFTEKSEAKWYTIKSIRLDSVEKHRNRIFEIRRKIKAKEEEKNQLEKKYNLPENTKDILNEYTLTLDLHEINQKRIDRDKLLIATESVKMVGAVTALSTSASGVGILVGSAIGAAGSAMEAAASVYRSGKQYMKDRDASNASKGKQDFDASVVKSSEAKKKKRQDDVYKIIELCKKSDGKNTKQINSYLKATGVNVNYLYSMASPKNQIVMIYKALESREAE